MDHMHHFNKNEKSLLAVLGKNPEIPLKELVNYTTYKRANSIVRKIVHLKEKRVIFGPKYYIDPGKLCKNPLHSIICVVELEKPYNTVISFLKLIEPLISVYPILTSHKEIVHVAFLSSHDSMVESLLQLLKENNIIAGFTIRIRNKKTCIENPDFSGESVPSLDGLLDSCEFPDLSLGTYTTAWNECDIAVLNQVIRERETPKLIDILREERKRGSPWTYEQIKYSHAKLRATHLMTKTFFISPFPIDQCSDFYLHFKATSMEYTQRILYNFGKGGRLYKEYTLCGEWGRIGCICHPRLALGLMYTLDGIDEITHKELYHFRSFNHVIEHPGGDAVLKYYDVESQTLHYPYDTFRENIKEKIDELKE
ncbi:MAG: hypothetical protein HXS45_14030 [Theionarchaea archaeon]|nr:hypothetical protein [Theionarchaea archaeon]